MQEDEKVLEPNLEENPVQQEQELELEPQPKVDTQDGDPLDKIEDPEELRKEAKKLRAIANRHKDKKLEVKVEEKPKLPEGDYLKKSDFELANQKKGIRLATTPTELDSEEVKTAKLDMLENWEAIRSFYTPRRGKDTPEDVLEDIKDAYVIFNTRRPTRKEDKPDTTFLTATVVKNTGTTVSPKVVKKEPPRFKLPTQVKDWYSKPN